MKGLGRRRVWQQVEGDPGILGRGSEAGSGTHAALLTWPVALLSVHLGFSQVNFSGHSAVRDSCPWGVKDSLWNPEKQGERTRRGVKAGIRNVVAVHTKIPCKEESAWRAFLTLGVLILRVPHSCPLTSCGSKGVYLQPSSGLGALQTPISQAWTSPPQTGAHPNPSLGSGIALAPKSGAPRAPRIPGMELTESCRGAEKTENSIQQIVRETWLRMTLGPQSKIYVSDSDIVSTSMLLALKQIDLTMCIERQPCALHIAVIRQQECPLRRQHAPMCLSPLKMPAPPLSRAGQAAARLGSSAGCGRLPGRHRLQVPKLPSHPPHTHRRAAISEGASHTSWDKSAPFFS